MQTVCPPVSLHSLGGHNNMHVVDWWSFCYGQTSCYIFLKITFVKCTFALAYFLLRCFSYLRELTRVCVVCDRHIAAVTAARSRSFCRLPVKCYVTTHGCITDSSARQHWDAWLGADSSCHPNQHQHKGRYNGSVWQLCHACWPVRHAGSWCVWFTEFSNCFIYTALSFKRNVSVHTDVDLLVLVITMLKLYCLVVYSDVLFVVFALLHHLLSTRQCLSTDVCLEKDCKNCSVLYYGLGVSFLFVFLACHSQYNRE